MPLIEVNLPGHEYSILIGCGALGDLGEAVRAVAPHPRAALFVDTVIMETHGGGAMASLMEAGIHAVVVPVEAQEKKKSLDSVNRVYRGLIKSSHERGSPIIALGGGVVGDLAGFVAATYLRGVPFVQVPTTLLAMVDASIGGKTGVNFPLPDGTLGKNLIGAFHQPRAVIADPEVLRTLPTRDFRCGLAECIKHAMIADASLLEFIAHNADRICALDMPILTTLIERCASIKAEIVQSDEREHGRRALLNLGHTFAHVIESLPELDLRHGEAVSVGLVAAITCSLLTHRIKQSEAARVRKLLEKVGLPVRMRRPVSTDKLIAAMGYDKKVLNGQMRLILPRGIGEAEIVSDMPLPIIEAAWQEVGAGGN